MNALRRSNLELNGRETHERRTVLQSYPTILFVELTQNCNLSCRMCRSAGPYDPSRDMSLPLFERVREELFPYAEMVDLRGWGESTILASFPQRLRETLATGIRVRLITNALAITGELWDLLFSAESVVGVSFDSADPDRFEQLGRGNWHRVVHNLRQGIAALQRSGRGELYLKPVLSSFTLHEAPDLIRLAADIGIKRVVMNPIKCPESQFANLIHVAGRIPQILSKSAELARELGVKLQLGSALVQSQAVDYGLPDVCSNPWSHALIDYQGRVGFCDHLINKPEFTMGNLREQPFRQIWNCDGFQRLRYAHTLAATSRTLPDEFRKCTYCYSNRYREADHETYAGLESREVSTSTGLPLYTWNPNAKPASSLRVL